MSYSTVLCMCTVCTVQYHGDGKWVWAASSGSGREDGECEGIDEEATKRRKQTTFVTRPLFESSRIQSNNF